MKILFGYKSLKEFRYEHFLYLPSCIMASSSLCSFSGLAWLVSLHHHLTQAQDYSSMGLLFVGLFFYLYGGQRGYVVLVRLVLAPS